MGPQGATPIHAPAPCLHPPSSNAVNFEIALALGRPWLPLTFPG